MLLSSGSIVGRTGTGGREGGGSRGSRRGLAGDYETPSFFEVQRILSELLVRPPSSSSRARIQFVSRYVVHGVHGKSSATRSFKSMDSTILDSILNITHFPS